VRGVVPVFVARSGQIAGCCLIAHSDTRVHSHTRLPVSYSHKGGAPEVQDLCSRSEPRSDTCECTGVSAPPVYMCACHHRARHASPIPCVWYNCASLAWQHRGFELVALAGHIIFTQYSSPKHAVIHSGVHEFNFRPYSKTISPRMFCTSVHQLMNMTTVTTMVSVRC
jgi:hypothetical protein